MEDTPPAESRVPEPPAPPPQMIEAPSSSAELLPPTVVATAPPPPPPPPEPAPAAAAPAAPVAALVHERGRGWAVFSHLLLFAAIPTIFLGGVVTFLVWQLIGKDQTFVEEQAREALNFQINVALLSLLLAASFIGMPLVVLLWLVAGIVSLVAARHAWRGERYRYPAILRIVTH